MEKAKEELSENDKGLAWGNANLRMQTTIFKTVARDNFGQLVEDFSVFLVWATEKLNYDPLTAQQLFTKEREKTLNRFFGEEIQKIVDSKQLEKDSIGTSIDIIRKVLVPFILDIQRKWDERMKDEITGQSSPTALAMILQVCPAIVSTDSIINPTAYAQMLRSTYNDYEIRFSYERQLSDEDRERHAEKFGSIIIKLKAAIFATP